MSIYCEPDHPERSAWQARIVELLAEGLAPCVPKRIAVLPGDVQMVFHFIPPGTFLMGSPESEESRSNYETQHRVKLTRGFWMGAHPVTQAQWTAVMGDNPSLFLGETLPVDSISWNDSQEFIAALGERTGERCRQPTEAEWEHACRAGTTYGSGKRGVFREKTTPGGTFPFRCRFFKPLVASFFAHQGGMGVQGWMAKAQEPFAPRVTAND